MRRPSVPILSVFAIVVPAHLAFAQRRDPTDVEIWRALKASLQANDGDSFFESNVKDAVIAGGNLHSFKGTVVSSRSGEHPSEVVVAISDSTQPEVTLRFTDKQGQEDHFKGSVTPGSKIVFAGIARAYSKEPFMLTLEAEGQDGSGPTFASVVTLEPQKQGITMPGVSVNYPYSLNTRFGKISLDGLPLYRVAINDHGVTTETMGVRLERFLVTAGWFPHSSDDQPHYAVEIDGVQTLTTLEMFGLGSFDKQAWLVPTETPEASLVVIQADGTLIQKVEGIQRIRVSERP